MKQGNDYGQKNKKNDRNQKTWLDSGVGQAE